MPRASWNGIVIAESNRCIVVECNQYFPPETVNHDFLRASKTHTLCAWKGMASYYDVVVNDESIKDAAWYYPQTKAEAQHIKGYIAFWKGVKVEI